MSDASRPGAVCIFCLVHRDREQPNVCTYKMHHEYPEDNVVVKPLKQAHRPNKSLCTRCGLHPKNPRFDASGCEHEFPQ